MSDTPSGGDKQAEAIFNAIAKTLFGFFRVVGFGFKQLPLKSAAFYVYTLTFFGVLTGAVLTEKHLELLCWLYPRTMKGFVGRLIFALSNEAHLVILLVAIILFALFIIGLIPWGRWRRYQRALDRVSLKDSGGLAAKIIGIQSQGTHRLKLTVLSEGVGSDRYETKKGDLQAAFGQVIENIKSGDNPKYVEITLAKRRVPEVTYFRDLIGRLNKPYSFLVGESIGGLITQNLRELPHLLVAGTTGGGKSVFFMQALWGLLRSSEHIQLYLLDLKGGADLKDFSTLPNAYLVNSELEAVRVLSLVKDEMEKRFVYLHKSNLKKIDPDRDKLDLIVIAIDEASVLYTKPSGKSELGSVIDQARELTDKLAKLGRAAGIHLIFATQKVTKETIDTRIQENVGGRLCYRTNTLHGSLTVLGDKQAYELRDHPGRAIWSKGNNFDEVQTPLLDEAEIEEEIKAVQTAYQENKKKNYQNMLTADDKVRKGPEFGQALTAA